MFQLTNHIYCMDQEAETDQPYIFFIHSSTKNIQIDAGNSPQKYAKFLKEVDELGFQKPVLVAITHWHWDHTFAIPAVTVPVLASKKTNEYLRKCETWEWTEKALKNRVLTGEEIQYCFDCMHLEYSDISKIRVRRADIEFDSDFSFDLGDVHVQAIVRDSPHTRDSVFYFVEEDRALIAGDAEFEDYYDYDSKYDPKRLISFIQFLEELDFDWYLCSHDKVKISKKEILDKMYLARENL